MGLEEQPHCPFDVMEACPTGVRRDSHQPGWKSSRPTAWPSPIRDRQVAAARVMVVQRRRWIGMELGLLMMGAESPAGRR